LALNFPNGAHHSDLSGKGPTDDDTDDIKQGFANIQSILAEWLAQLPGYQEREWDMQPSRGYSLR
jgi:hypothetical protein